MVFKSLKQETLKLNFSLREIKITFLLVLMMDVTLKERIYPTAIPMTATCTAAKRGIPNAYLPIRLTLLSPLYSYSKPFFLIESQNGHLQTIPKIFI